MCDLPPLWWPGGPTLPRCFRWTWRAWARRIGLHQQVSNISSHLALTSFQSLGNSNILWLHTRVSRSFLFYFILFYFISSRIVFPAIVLEQGTTITITLGPLPVYQAYGPHRTSTDLIVLPPHRMIQVLHSLPVLSTSTSSCRHQIGTLPDTTLDTRSM